ncbi:hypothetical protein SBOR_4781 [Sclerotinia borealis F-4128]|uniref:Uncharacterized protein n=1 Tax=Sclerotinia borealis (strain F-4128) TaxID=1432307 RepID=W9CG55_SCLBF|nr:hypothetical protein SBOR_4781 [Sclerotinia borealis F-4128]
MPSAVAITIIAFCMIVLFAMVAWAFFWPHKYHRYGMDHSKKAAKKRSRTAGRSHHNVEMHPKHWGEGENSQPGNGDGENHQPRIGKTRPMPKYDSEKDASDWV